MLELLFRTHYCAMTRLARTILDDEEEAEDVVQNVFARLMEKGMTVPENKTEAYLMTAVRNGCHNVIRKKQLRKQVKNLYPVTGMADEEPIETSIRKFNEIQDYMDEMLAEPHSSIMRMRFDDELTLKEIAQRLDMNINTVYKYLRQSIRQLRKHFKQD